jgi:NAD(P)H dehydrogenase (quinone)
VVALAAGDDEGVDGSRIHLRQGLREPLAYVGFSILEPFVAYGVECLRYSDDSALRSRLENVATKFREALAALDERACIPFNRMAEWESDGRIVASAPAYSPFIRHRSDL